VQACVGQQQGHAASTEDDAGADDEVADDPEDGLADVRASGKATDEDVFVSTRPGSVLIFCDYLHD
jgi:hypothetical protein